MDYSLFRKQSAVNCLDESIKSLSNIVCESPLNSNNCLISSEIASTKSVKLRRLRDNCLTSPETKYHTYRISMANLEETQESELDLILGELSLLEGQNNFDETTFSSGDHIENIENMRDSICKMSCAPTNGSICSSEQQLCTHSRTNSMSSAATNFSIECNNAATLTTSSSEIENGLLISGNNSHQINIAREPRTESPDNDSAFSDTVSLLSSESSASSSTSLALHNKKKKQQQNQLNTSYMPEQFESVCLSANSKAAKIQLALHKLETASVRRLFVKAFTSDGASKSLLVDERMTCGHVTRLLADKNHVQMQTNWALVENLGDFQMERIFEDHELLVDILMTWNSDAGNRVLFQQRPEKVAIFNKPELYLPGPQMAPGSSHDEHTRTMLLEEFFESNSHLQVEGPLHMKADSKKGWKRYHFVLRSSGLYYFSKEKTKSIKDLTCLTLFNGNNVYCGIGWKKKWKAPTEHTFGFKSTLDSSIGKTCRSVKMLCAEDQVTLDRWMTAIRISKYGKYLWESYKTLIDDLNLGDNVSNKRFAVSMRSESITSISSSVPSQCGSVSSAISSMSNSSSGRISRASSSSSSGCLSDDNNGFDSEFTTGTIKRKPSIKPNLPLTTMTRQLKEVGEITICESSNIVSQEAASPERSGTLTRRHSRHKSQESNNSGTLKRRQSGTTLAVRGSTENVDVNIVNSLGSSSAPTPTTQNDCIQQNVELSLREKNEMSSSTLSLDSLPPPPPPLINTDEHDFYSSQLSLVSLPPPPQPDEVLICVDVQATSKLNYNFKNSSIPPVVPAKPIKPAVKSIPHYKSNQECQISNGANPSTGQYKKVSFADSPVLLRRKTCFTEAYVPLNHTSNLYSVNPIPTSPHNIADTTATTHSFGSPKRLQESSSNPPRDFLKDLQRVMRKKWQVAQKCKLEPSTTPHEVLGFRDFSDEFLSHNINANSNSTHFYRETANVSNWVQEHYGAGAPPLPVPHSNEYALYENLHVGKSANRIIESQFSLNGVAQVSFITSNQRKKRPPPPPPPKRSDSTHLSHRI